MLSFKNGKPFVIIRGGSCNNKIIRIHDGTENDNEDYQIGMKKLKHLDPMHLQMLEDAIDNEDPSYLSGKILQMYNKVKNNGDLGKHFHDDNGIFSIIPTDDPNQRDSIYITGPSGSGKSYFVSNFISEYKKRYPKREVILFSAKDEDPALDKYKPGRIKLTDEMAEDPIDLKELENTLVVFDDIDQIGNKKIQDAVWNLRDRILEVGRSLQISICTVAHQITNYKASRICLNEADYVVFFPQSGARFQINYFLKNYAGMDKEQIDGIKKLKSRAVILKKTYPMCLVYQNGCYII
jgi:Cdc6-like AAA superfamily ATPase